MNNCHKILKYLIRAREEQDSYQKVSPVSAREQKQVESEDSGSGEVRGARSGREKNFFVPCVIFLDETSYGSG